MPTAEETKLALEIKGLKADSKVKDTAIESLSGELETVKARNEELEALASKNPATKLIVEGSFTHKKVKYGFLDGWKKTRNLTGEVITSEEALKDSDLMRHLIEMKYAGIEVVK